MSYNLNVNTKHEIIIYILGNYDYEIKYKYIAAKLYLFSGIFR